MMSSIYIHEQDTIFTNITIILNNYLQSTCNCKLFLINFKYFSLPQQIIVLYSLMLGTYRKFESCFLYLHYLFALCTVHYLLRHLEWAAVLKYISISLIKYSAIIIYIFIISNINYLPTLPGAVSITWITVVRTSCSTSCANLFNWNDNNTKFLH